MTAVVLHHLCPELYAVGSSAWFRSKALHPSAGFWIFHEKSAVGVAVVDVFATNAIQCYHIPLASCDG